MYKHSKLTLIMNEPENRLCFDCASTNVTHASINNGVLLCSLCSEKHLKLNNQISTVKSMYDDTWSDDEARFLEISGNRRFLGLMHEYNIPKDKNFDFKYSTIAAYYYRKLVYSELTNSKAPIKPDSNAGTKMMTEDMMKEAGFFTRMKESIVNFGGKIAEKTKELFTSSSHKDEIGHEVGQK